jgi:hypothetical protein
MRLFYIKDKHTHTKFTEYELQYNIHCVKFIKLMFIFVFDTTLQGKRGADKALHVFHVIYNSDTHIYLYTSVIPRLQLHEN